MFLAASCEQAGLKRGICRLWKNRKDEKTPRYVLRLLIFFATPKQRAGQADSPKSERTSCLAGEGGTLT